MGALYQRLSSTSVVSGSGIRTAASAIDLNPFGFTISDARDVAGMYQAGYGHGPGTGDFDHALVWSGTAESALESSQALGVDVDGIVVGYALDMLMQGGY